MYAYYNTCIPFTIPKKPSRSPKSLKPPPLPLLRTRFSAQQLLHHFHKLLPASLLAGWLALSPRTFYARAFTPLVTLWYMIFQRLSNNHHLSHVQEDAREGGADSFESAGQSSVRSDYLRIHQCL